MTYCIVVDRVLCGTVKRRILSASSNNSRGHPPLKNILVPGQDVALSPKKFNTGCLATAKNPNYCTEFEHLVCYDEDHGGADWADMALLNSTFINCNILSEGGVPCAILRCGCQSFVSS